MIQDQYLVKTNVRWYSTEVRVDSIIMPNNEIIDLNSIDANEIELLSQPTCILVRRVKHTSHPDEFLKKSQFYNLDSDSIPIFPIIIANFKLFQNIYFMVQNLIR